MARIPDLVADFMRRFSSLVFAALLPCAASAASVQPATEETTEWTLAKVYSIEVGRSRIDELTRVVGKPKDQTDNENLIMKGRSRYKYEVSWPLEGELWAWVDAPSKLVVELQFKPKNGRMSDVIEEFGSDYRIKRYRTRECEGKPSHSTICPDRKGPILVFEYPQKGVVVFPGPNGALNDLLFVAQTPFILSCDCGEDDHE